MLELLQPHATLFALILVIGAGVALVALQRLRDHLAEARIRDRRSTLLYELSQRLTLVVDGREIAHTLAATVEETLQRGALVFLRAADGRPQLIDRPATAAPPIGAAEHAAAAHALAADEPVSAGSGLAAGSPWTFLPLSLPQRATAAGDLPPRALGVLAVHQGALSRGPRAEEEARLLYAMRDQAALALERVRLVEREQNDRLLAESERLRSAMLASVSHDLRTPLASIMGGASSLLELGPTLNEAARRELLESVLSEAERLDRFVQNLLDMTRLGHGALVPQRQWSDVRDLIGGAQRVLRRTLADREVQVEVAADFPLLLVDPYLLEHVLTNLLDNAHKYSPPGAPLRIGAESSASRCRLAIEDEGRGIPAADRERVFDMFARVEARDRQVAGTGLGLAICRGFVTALGGSIVADQGPGGRGTRIVIDLPRTPMPVVPAHDEEAA